MKKVVFLDRQHIGQIRKPSDLGAFSRLVGRHEAEMVADYFNAAELAFRKLGIDVIPVSDGRYSDRHMRVLEYANQGGAGKYVYVAGHLNAGGGDYGAAFYDHRSTMGANCATFIADALSEHCPELERTLQIKAQPNDWTLHAFNTIKGIFVGRPCAICYEPCFVDKEAHVPLLEPQGLERIGEALAFGINKWMENK